MKDQTIDQIANVATLPGLVGASLAMPDAHQGYGFPIGGVAAADVEKGIVSAGGVGFDINCGVRLLAADMQREEIERHLGSLMDRLFATIPCGTGKRGSLRLNENELDSIFREGSRWAIERGYGYPEDIEKTEADGKIPDADPSKVSSRARLRGREQLGTLGSGNHFVEVQYVESVYDAHAADAFGLREGQITVLIHTGSRGLGHQVCTDYVDAMQSASRKYGIQLVDRQLACAPIRSPEGQAYLGAMRGAANFAFANRQLIAESVRRVFGAVFPSVALRLVYDVAHNIAKEELHTDWTDGREKRVLVHRKGATRAFPRNHPDIPDVYQAVGQPVLIPGSMGTSSYVLVGTEAAMNYTFGSCCHGAGRMKSRHSAMKDLTAEELIASLNRSGIEVRGASKRGLTEEHPGAYKDVSQVVRVVEEAGIAQKVARLIPIGVIKG